MRRDEDGARRRVYELDGVEGYWATWTGDCSGCIEVGDYGTKYGPYGCSECGHIGKRRVHFFVPFDPRDEERLSGESAQQTRVGEEGGNGR